jgi:hypothetical protein
MTLHIAIAWGALLASAALLFLSTSRVLAVVAVLAAGLEVAMAYGLIQVRIPYVPLGLVFPLGLAVPGLVVWLRTSTKPAVSAAAIVAFVGVVQLAMFLTSQPG